MPATHCNCPATLAAAVSPAGRFVLSIAGGAWLLWDVVAGRPERVGTVNQIPPGPLAIALSDDGRTLLVGGADGSVRAFDLPTGRAVWSGEAHTCGVVSVALVDGARAISVGGDGTIRSGNVPTLAMRTIGWQAWARVVAKVGAAAGVAAGLLPPWSLALLSALGGVRPGWRVRIALSLRGREVGGD